MIYLVNNDKVQEHIDNPLASTDEKKVWRHYAELLKSGRNLQARLFTYANGDVQLRIFEYDKQRYCYVMLEKIFLD